VKTSFVFVYVQGHHAAGAATYRTPKKCSALDESHMRCALKNSAATAYSYETPAALFINACCDTCATALALLYQYSVGCYRNNAQQRLLLFAPQRDFHHEHDG
jgi:hypothetical protein